MTKRLVLACLGLLAASSHASAQSGRPWTIAAGPAVLWTESTPNYGTVGNSAGGLLRADIQLRRFEKFSVGIGAHAALLRNLEAIQRYCTQSSSCDERLQPYVRYFGGVGLAVQYGSSGSTGWQYHFRGFAEPIVGRIVQLRSIGPDWTFAASYGGAALGISRGRFRLDLEAGLGINVRADYPKVASLQLGFAP